MALARAGGTAAPADIGAAAFVAIIAVWIAVPYAILGLAARRAHGGKSPRYVLGVASLAITGFTAYLGYQRALTDIVFIVLPLW